MPAAIAPGRDHRLRPHPGRRTSNREADAPCTAPQHSSRHDGRSPARDRRRGTRRHLVSNLVRKAIQHNKDNGHTCLRIENRTLTIQNTGAHIPPIKRRPSSNPSADRTSSRHGLSIVRSIAQAHGATVYAEPGEDGGLQVRVTQAHALLA
ncbi:ATP-binding protein [Nonomuraea sp. NPDC059194]|uniref:ATP-binding protein n=1 Tax=Nonomuraea sp. NPDC059194 TaxID=3346764 RepID=UPI003682BE5A